MGGKLQVKIDAFENGAVIPDKYAFCIPDKASHAALGQNLSPAIRWSGAPPGSRGHASAPPGHGPTPTSSPSTHTRSSRIAARSARFSACTIVIFAMLYLAIRTLRGALPPLPSFLELLTLCGE